LLFSPGCQKQAPESRFLTPGEFSPGGSGPKADLRSLVFALENAIATSVINPLWQQMLTFAEEALP
jgi:hypothetical protein